MKYFRKYDPQAGFVTSPFSEADGNLRMPLLHYPEIVLKSAAKTLKQKTAVVQRWEMPDGYYPAIAPNVPHTLRYLASPILERDQQSYPIRKYNDRFQVVRSGIYTIAAFWKFAVTSDSHLFQIADAELRIYKNDLFYSILDYEYLYVSLNDGNYWQPAAGLGNSDRIKLEKNDWIDIRGLVSSSLTMDQRVTHYGFVNFEFSKDL